jgi:hypothetical protein
MTITYRYEVIKVDEAARCMEVVYASEGHQTMHIGARLPFQGETLESVIKAFAPVAYWRDQERAVVAPSVGVSGVMQEPMIAPTTTSSEDQFASVFPTPPTGSIEVTTLGE